MFLVGGMFDVVDSKHTDPAEDRVTQAAIALTLKHAKRK